MNCKVIKVRITYSTSSISGQPQFNFSQWRTRRFYDGCNITRRTSRSGGHGTPAQWAAPGGWMRPTSRCAANGSTCTEPSTRPEKTVDFFLSRQQDINAAKAFLRQAIKGQRVPAKVTLDAYAASPRAVADLKGDGELPKRVVVRSSKYLNNLIEQDHRRIKQRLRPMLGLKAFRRRTL
jgi:hypothetical protein